MKERGEALRHHANNTKLPNVKKVEGDDVKQLLVVC